MYSIAELEHKLALPIAELISLSGGDICQAYELRTNSQTSYFAKFHPSHYASSMFACEALGLQAIAKTNTCPVPEVIYLDAHLLCLTFIASGSASNRSWSTFGRQLAEMHKQAHTQYGFELDGYIGKIKQKNSWCDNGYEFICNQRLTPLIKILHDSGVMSDKLLHSYENIISRIDKIIPLEDPCLIHGDLWSGNVIQGEQTCYLIDCAPAYNHRAFDLAMMALFGGFNQHCMDAYEAEYSIPKELKSCLDLFQLYYLLIHLILFGRSYYAPVVSIINKYAKQ